MALVTFEFESQYLGNNHTVGVILPDKPRNLTPRNFTAAGKNTRSCGCCTEPSEIIPTGFANP